MKALLYKDLLCLWRENRGTWAVFAALLLFSCAGKPEGAAMAFHIVLLIFPLLAQVEGPEEWQSLLNMLPYSPRDRVVSKYITLWSLYLCAALIILPGTALLSPTAAVRREVLVSFLILLALSLFLSALFYALLFQGGFASRDAWTAYLLGGLASYVIAVVVLGLVRESPLTPADVRPYLIIALVTNLVSVPFSVSQYHKRKS